MDDLPAIMKTAKEYQNQGRLDEAEAIYLKILEIDGSNAEAFHLLGLICHARGNFDVAAEAIGSAIIIDPGVAEFHANLSATELSRGQPALANSHAGVPSNWIPPLIQPTIIMEIRILHWEGLTMRSAPSSCTGAGPRQ